MERSVGAVPAHAGYLARGGVEEVKAGWWGHAAPVVVKRTTVEVLALVGAIRLDADTDDFPDVFRLVGLGARSAHTGRERPAGGEGLVPDHLGVHAEARAAAEQAVITVLLDFDRRLDGGLAIGRRGECLAVEGFDVPAGSTEFNREPVEQFGVRRQRAHDAEVFRGLDEPLAEEFLPHPVDGDTRGERVLLADQPASEAEAVLGGIGREFAEGGRDFGRDLFALLVVGAADQDVRHRHHVLTLFLDVGEWAAVLDGLELRFELLLPRGGDLDVGTADADVVFEELVLGLGAGFAGKQGTEIVDLREDVGLSPREGAVVEA